MGPKIFLEASMTHQILITRQDVETLTGFKKAFIYREMKAGKFPRPVRIGPKAVRWVEAEIREWTEARITEARMQQPDAPDAR